ncbi:hypothetical protein NIES970_05300 [[Synechococcus] sp. NIES-970]|uniref:DUF760 domain-containing protein n=1 Tax=Picosynechococcus sp. NKBG15041c TaxID=1407650 RepID=UPI000429E778|nr:DUF760 domain-containing protein [Picosynechococcus sp. NKBG15041c]BAW95621.1 hypothetical protein NIES970_05300 [[Synechococcus] sp. NIES-970]
MIFNSDFFPTDVNEQTANNLMEYLQQQNPDVLARVAQSASSEIKDLIAHNVRGLIGVLPPDDFQVSITTDRENLANLLASAMMTGYFLGQMEQRMNLEDSLIASGSLQRELDFE